MKIIFVALMLSPIMAFSQSDSLSFVFDKYYASDLTQLFTGKVNAYADSLNNLGLDDELPEFLIKHFSYLEFVPGKPLHDRDFFRQALFEKITNPHTLRKISYATADVLDEIEYLYIFGEYIPLSKLSLRQLAQKRLDELGEKY